MREVMKCKVSNCKRDAVAHDMPLCRHHTYVVPQWMRTAYADPVEAYSPDTVNKIRAARLDDIVAWVEDQEREVERQKILEDANEAKKEFDRLTEKTRG